MSDDFKGHTPGPWKAHLEEVYFVTGPDLGRVALMMNLKGAHGLGGRRSGGESAANARLIAAAPAMAEELTRLRAEVEALRADAERYRWLRHGDNDEPCLHFSADCKAGTDTVWLLRGDKLDAAIDAARAALNQEVK